MNKKLVEKVTVTDRRCGICLKLWPKGTTFFAPLREGTFSCPDGRHASVPFPIPLSWKTR